MFAELGVTELAAMPEQLETTLAMIKPDAVRAGNVDAIMEAMLNAGFTIVAKKRFEFTSGRAAEFYKEHKGKRFYKHLVGFMSSGPSYALALAKTNAIADYRNLIVDLRLKFATNNTFNAVHGSDSPASARRELRFHFPHIPLLPLPDGAKAKTYVEDMLQPTIIAGLTALCRARPAQADAVAWLAAWLKEHNPYKPESIQASELRFDFAQEDPEMEAAAALKIQSVHRGRLARKRVNGIKQSRSQAAAKPAGKAVVVDKEAHAALKIQSIQRGRVARKRVENMRGPRISFATNASAASSEQEEDPDKEHNAAMKIQSVHRGRAARKRVGRMREAHPDEEAALEAAAAAKAAAMAAEVSADQEEYEEAHSAAALRIQSVHRGRAARKRVSALKASGGATATEVAEAEAEAAEAEAEAEVAIAEEAVAEAVASGDADAEAQARAALRIQTAQRRRAATKRVQGIRESRAQAAAEAGGGGDDGAAAAEAEAAPAAEETAPAAEEEAPAAEAEAAPAAAEDEASAPAAEE